MSKPALDDQVAEVGREVGLRRNVYQRLIAKGQMTQAAADLHLARMEAAYRTLKWLKKHEARIKAALGKAA